MSEQEGDSGEKEFDASEQKQKKARDDGDIAQSKEVNALAVIVGLICACFIANAFTGEALLQLFSSLFYHAEGFAEDAFRSGSLRTMAWLQAVCLQLLPIFAALMSFVVLVLIVTRGVAFSSKKIQPKLENISPAGNIKKKYGARGLLDFVRDAAKMIFAGVIASVFLFNFAQDYYASTAIQKGQFAAFTFDQTLKIILAFGLFQFLLAAIDFPIQRMMHAGRLKMTREEMKKESKDSEGDPHTKQARRQRASEISRSQMLQGVKSATVVIVNPEHYAVALKWDPDSQQAPLVVAKGVDFLAAKIREVAIANSVPIFRDPPITRAIYATVDIDQEIRPEHFAAVAAAIQFVQRIRDET